MCVTIFASHNSGSFNLESMFVKVTYIMAEERYEDRTGGMFYYLKE